LSEAVIRGSTSAARDSERLAELIELGIDTPSKLDLIAAVEAAPGYEALDALAASCAMSQREAQSVLDQLARARLVECRRLYNLTEYGSTPAEEIRARVRELIGATPADQRRQRRALLAFVNRL